MTLRTRLRAGVAAITLVAGLAVTAQAHAAYTTIAGSPMTLYVGDQGQLQGTRTGDTSNIFFAPSNPVGDAGFFLAFPAVTGSPAQQASLDSKVFGFTGSAGPTLADQYTPRQQLAVTGSGTAADPLTQITDYAVNPTDTSPANDVASVRQTVTYVTGALTFNVKWVVTNLKATPLRFKAIAGADFYFEGSDRGTGVFTQGPPRFIGGTNADTGRSGGFIEAIGPSLSPPWSAYQALPYGPDLGHSTVWDRVESSASSAAATLDNSVEGTQVDNAGAVEWDQYLDAAKTLAQNATATFELTVRISAPAALQFDQTNAGAPQGMPVTITATAKDTADAPFTGKLLRWTITGANTLSGNTPVDAAGHAAVVDPGTNAGADTLVAYVDLNNNTIRDPNEPQASALITFIDNIPPKCAVSISGDRPGLGGGAGKPLVISVNCDSPATVTAAATLTITPPAAGAKQASAAASRKKAKKRKPRTVTVRLKTQTLQVLPGVPVPFSLKIPAATAKKYAGAKVTETVTVTAVDSAGNRSTVTAKKTTTLAKPKKKKKKKR